MNFDRVVIVTAERAAGWCKAMAAEMGQALAAQGLPVQRIEAERLAELPSFPEGSTLFIDFNHRVVTPSGQPKLAIMVDHPSSLMGELTAPQSSAAVTSWVDNSHLAALQALGFAHRAFFLPHAGPLPSMTVPSLGEREIDVFFAGTLEEPAQRPPRIGTMLSFADLTFDAVERRAETGEAVLPAVLGVLDQHELPRTMFPRDTLAQLMASVLRIGEINRRIEVLSALPDHLHVVIASEYLPEKLRSRSNITFLGHVDDFDHIRALMRNSRIVLNTTAKFPAGSHERIWYAMAEGAVVLTDISSFMQRDFAAGENVLYLPQKKIAADDLAPLATVARDKAALARMAESAAVIYPERHSWERRAPQLVEALRAA